MSEGLLTIEQRKARLLDQLENSALSDAEVTTIERKLEILRAQE